MPQKNIEFQPGAILHDVIVGAFRASGSTFETLCNENGILPRTARNSTFGQGRGSVGRKNLERFIDAAGREFIRSAYLRRVTDHYHYIRKGAGLAGITLDAAAMAVLAKADSWAMIARDLEQFRRGLKMQIEAAQTYQDIQDILATAMEAITAL